MNRKPTGFSLVEVLVALAIVSILSSVASPSLKSLFLHTRSKSNIGSIQQVIQLARNHAVSYGTRVTVCPIEANQCVNDWQNGFTVFTDGGQSNSLEGNDTVLFVMGPFNEEDISYYNRKSIRFQPDGLASGTNGTFRYCPGSFNSPYSKAVIVNQSGRIRFSKDKSIECKQT
ncbi:GspH/FimT family pseudopilin [Shewanella olleyana]|uniref:GspH/FimT family pseudopilin n=1 Tax=Shewanella olleyana TaxID=135626 RepID=UPI00200F5643|nr:GspH/FimT family pseudopilin [Shewanella olleyana]MCL1068261.1 GspH/FimT family pseudopilin [Shewanella olleyana]